MKVTRRQKRFLLFALIVAAIGGGVQWYIMPSYKLGDVCDHPKAKQLHPDSLHCRTYGDGIEFCYTGNQTAGLFEIVVRQKCVISDSVALRNKRRETEYYCHGFMTDKIDCKYRDHKLAHGKGHNHE